MIILPTQETNQTAEWIATIAAAVTAIATLGLVIGAVLAWHTAKKTLDQMRQDSAAQTRPYVYAKLEPSMGGRQAWDLVIKNVGQTAAKDLTLVASAWPENDDDAVRDLKKLFATPRTLPPGTSIRSYWNLDFLNQDPSQNKGVTDPVTVTVKYVGTSQKKGPGYEPFSEDYELDPTAVGMTPLGWPGKSIRDDKPSPYLVKLQEILIALGELRRNL